MHLQSPEARPHSTQTFSSFARAVLVMLFCLWETCRPDMCCTVLYIAQGVSRPGIMSKGSMSLSMAVWRVALASCQQHQASPFGLHAFSLLQQPVAHNIPTWLPPSRTVALGFLQNSERDAVNSAVFICRSGLLLFDQSLVPHAVLFWSLRAISPRQSWMTSHEHP